MVAYRSSQGGLGALPPELHTSTVPVVVGASPLPSVPFIPQRHPPFPLLCLPFVHCLAVCLGRSEATHSQRDVGSSRVSFVSLFLLSLFSFPPLGSSFISVCCKPNWDKIHVELGQNSRRTGTKFTSNWDKIHVESMGQRLITCPICVMDKKNGRKPL